MCVGRIATHQSNLICLLHRLAEVSWPHRALDRRQAHVLADLRDLCRNPARTEPPERRHRDHGQCGLPQELDGRRPDQSHLTRSSLHRLFQRYGIYRLLQIEVDKPKKKFRRYPIGYFHIDIAEVRTAEGKLHMFVAIDRTSKFAVAELHERATRRIAHDFLLHLIEAVPYRIHTVLTDNGTQFTTPGNKASAAPLIKEAIEKGELLRAHGFELSCARNDIDHRLTKPNHPWTNGQVERMNRTLKEATIRRYYYETHDQLRTHLSAFIDAYNYAKRLKTLKGLTPFEYIAKCWANESHRFRKTPLHHSAGPNI